jgi:hypothetical protein
MRVVSLTQASADTRRRPPRRVGLAAFAGVALLLGAVIVWSAPRDDVAVPGPDASPEQVVAAYIGAVNARDFDTANAIDARAGSDLGRFSRPMRTHQLKMDRTAFEGATALWHITDAGVA